MYLATKLIFCYTSTMFWKKKKEIITDEQRIDEVLSRGVDEVIEMEDLKKKMMSGKQLRIKLGIDPTSPNLHIGRSIPLLKLKDFQELGHQIVFIVGDFTAVIGDTSDKDAERPMLDNEQVKENMSKYKEQASKILDMNDTEFRYNSEWLQKLNYHEIGEQANLFSIHQFISRDNIRRRIEAGKRVSLREVLYPLMQGYDSIAIKADVEVGGTDQRFNLLAGRGMQPHYNQAPQNILTNPLVNGLDGRKMSSSWGNTVNITDAPNDMYGKIMSMRDEEIVTYFITMTRLPLGEIKEIKKQLEGGVNPKVSKMHLAREIVTMYHGADSAEAAEKSWKSAFEKGGIPEDAKKVQVKMKIPLADMLVKQGVVKSKSEFRRLVKQGAIKFYAKTEERKIIDPDSLVEESGALKIGKKKFLKLIVKKEKSE